MPVSIMITLSTLQAHGELSMYKTSDDHLSSEQPPLEAPVVVAAKCVCLSKQAVKKEN